MKKTVILGFIAALLLPTFIVSVTVHAEDDDDRFDWWLPERSRFRVYGKYVCIEDEETNPDTYGNICNIYVRGRRYNGKWTGRGTWIDRDWHEGVLVIRLVFDDGWGELGDALTSLIHTFPPGGVTEIYDLFGDAHIWVDGVYRETRRFRMELFDGSQVNPDEDGNPSDIQPDLIRLTLPHDTQPPHWYHASANVIRGNVITRNPEYPGI